MLSIPSSLASSWTRALATVLLLGLESGPGGSTVSGCMLIAGGSSSAHRAAAQVRSVLVRCCVVSVTLPEVLEPAVPSSVPGTAGPGGTLAGAARGRGRWPWGAGARLGRARLRGVGTSRRAVRPTATRRSSSALAVSRHPTQVRTGPACGRLSERVSDERWRAAAVVQSTRARHRPAQSRSRRPRRGRRRRLARLLVGADVDAPAGEAGGEPGVLALLADRERELEVGDDHARGAASRSTTSTAGDPGRRQRVARRARPGRRTSRRCRSSRRAARSSRCAPAGPSGRCRRPWR